MMLPSPSRIALAALALPLVGGCGALTGSETSDDGVTRVVTAFYPLQYVAERVAGDRAEVSVLTSPGTEPHDLELTVRQTAEVAEADLAVHLSGLQPAVDEAVEQAAPAHVVDAADSADLVPPDEHESGHGAEHGSEHESGHGSEGSGDAHEHGELDPHFWLDPTRLADVAGAVEEQLAAVDPDGAAAYADNLADLRADLADLDADVRAGLADCDVDTVVVSHDAFGYFGERYGLDIHAINGLSPDAEPSPAHLRELAGLIESRGISTVFSETLATPRLADTLAGELDLETAVLDPVEGLGDQTADEDYLSLMRGNLAALEQANGCS